MANDFSLDPFQVEEDELAARYKQAVAKSLRSGANLEMGDIHGKTMSAFDSMQGRMEMPKIEKQRKELAAKYGDSLKEAISNQPPEVQQLVMHPATRTQGLEIMKKRSQMMLDQEEMNNLRGGSGSALPQTAAAGGASDVPPYDILVKMTMSSNPTIAARGKAGIEAYYKGHNPQDSVRYGPNGEAVPIPGAAAALGAAESAKKGAAAQYDMIDVPAPGGGTTKMSVAEYQRMRAGGSPEMPAPGPLGAGGGSVLPATRAAATQPGTAPSGLNTAPAPSGPEAAVRAQMGNLGMPGGQIPPEVQLQRDAQRLEMLKSELQASRDPREAQALTQEIRQTQGRMERMAQSMGAPQQASALPQTAAAARGPESYANYTPPQAPVPQNRLGTTPSPQDLAAMEQWKAQQAGEQKSRQEYLDKSSGGVADLQKRGTQLDEMTKLSGNMPSGKVGNAVEGVLNDVSSWFGISNPRVVNAERFTGLANEMMGSLIKQFGTNPSNVDLRTVAAMVPQAGSSQETRQLFLTQMKQFRDEQVAVQQAAAQMVRQGMPPDVAQQAAFQWYNDQQKGQGGGGNPPQAGGGNKPSALPSTAKAAGYQPEPGDGFLEGLPKKAMELPGSLISGSGWEAAKDSYGNIIEGGKQLLGMGDREKWVAEKARQDAQRAKDPRYDQARQFHDIVNPTALIGGTATTLPKVLASAGLQGAMQPGATLSDQLTEGAKSAFLGGTGSLVSRFIPSTKLADTVNVGGRGDELLNKFPSFRPTSAQANPTTWGSQIAEGVLRTGQARSVEQAQAITKDLLSNAGIASDRISPKVLSDATDAMGAEYSKMFPKNIRPVITTAERDSLTAAVKAVPEVQDLMARAPKLAAIHNALSNAQGAVKISAADLHDAWKEVGQVAQGQGQAAGQVRGVLEGLIQKVVPKGELAAFKELNRKWGAVEDIKRVWSAGKGEGQGAAAGTLLPAKLVTEAGSGPTANSMTDEAAQLVNQFNARNPRNTFSAELSIPGMAQTVMANTVGRAINFMDRSALREGTAAKRIAEALRATGNRGVPAAYNGRE
jgi:hypothetical protein